MKIRLLCRKETVEKVKTVMYNLMIMRVWSYMKLTMSMITCW